MCNCFKTFLASKSLHLKKYQDVGQQGAFGGQPQTLIAKKTLANSSPYIVYYPRY